MGIRDETFDVQLPTLHDLRTETTSSEGCDRPDMANLANSTLAYSLHRFCLDKTISKIKLSLYHLPSMANTSVGSSDYDAQKRLHHELKEWAAGIQPVCMQLQVSEPERQRWRLHLEALYYAALVLLFQPSQIFPTPTNEHTNLCFNAAADQLSCYNALYESDMLQVDWKTVRSIFACGATIIYCFWTSRSVQNSAAVAHLASSLRMCSTLLIVGSVWWPSVRRGTASFERLVELTLRKANSNSSQREPSKRRRIIDRHNVLNDDLDADIVQNDQSIATARARQAFTGSESVEQGCVPFPQSDFDALSHEQPSAFTPNTLEHLTYGYLDEAASSSQMYDLSTDVMTQETQVEPEIELFLSDFFLDDGGWNKSDTGPPIGFHFGNL